MRNKGIWYYSHTSYCPRYSGIVQYSPLLLRALRKSLMASIERISATDLLFGYNFLQIQKLLIHVLHRFLQGVIVHSEFRFALTVVKVHMVAHVL